ncbi:MAG: PAS domain S-box protein [Deltaproteobacteria bacterium]|nr:PAS domain S-box protein [Deltaproteobacteria bacterium]
MHIQYNHYLLPVIIATIISFSLAGFGLKRRNITGAIPFIVLMLAVGTWSFEYIFQLAGTILPEMLFWTQIQYISIAIVPIAWLALALQYTGKIHWLTLQRLGLLSIIPIITIVMLITNEMHGLMMYGIHLDTSGYFPILDRTFGPWFWVHSAFCYILLFIGSFLFIKALIRSPHLYRGQSGALLIGALAPWIGNAVYISGLSPLPTFLDPTIFMFTLSGIAMAWGIFRYHLLDIVPIAYDTVIKSMSDSVVILDGLNRVVDLNETSQWVIGKTASEVIGQPMAEVLSDWPNLVEKLCDTIEGHSEIILEKDGEKRYFDLRISPLYGYGHLTGRLIVLRDITESKRREETLLEKEEKFRSAFTYAAIGMAIVDTDGFFQTVNPFLCEMLGYAESQLLAKKVKEIIHPEDIEFYTQLHDKIFYGELPYVWLETRYIHKKGHVVYGMVSSSLLKDTDGSPICFVSQIQNISERKRNEEKEKQYLTDMEFLSNTALSFVELSPDGNIYKHIGKQIQNYIGQNAIIIVHAYKEMSNELHIQAVLGIDQYVDIVKEFMGDDLIGMHFTPNETALEVLHSGALQEVRGLYELTFGTVAESICKTVEDLLDLGKIYTMGFTTQDKLFGNVVIILPIGANLPSKNILETLLNQASIAIQRKLADEALRESEQRYSLHFANTSDVMCTIDSNNRVVMVSPSIERILGYKPQEILGTGLYNLNILTPETLKTATMDMKTILAGKNITSAVYTFIAKDGNQIFGEISGVPLIRDGKTVAKIYVARDITARKKAEEELRHSEHRYRFLVENVFLGLFIAELPSGQFTYLNDKICEMFGFSLEEFQKLTLWDIIIPDEHELVHTRISAKSKGELPTSASMVFTAKRKDGTSFRINASAAPVSFQGKPSLQGVVMDVTETEMLEKQLQQAKKMEAIGTLAGGIAHDFNNLLMGIQGNASLMQANDDLPQFISERTKNIEEYVQRGSNLTKQLLGFARGGRYEVKPTDLNDLIRKSADLFGRTKKEIAIHHKFQTDLWIVEIDPGQMDQVLLNLLVNAWQAMPGGGELYISTENAVLDKDFVKPYRISPGKYVKVSITDTGIGMDEITKQRIFEPFFTTKEMNRGTGLGLASVYGIIENHGGHINVYSEKENGTTFTIYLPASTKTVEVEKTGVLETLTGVETVLLVDDEEMITEVASAMLKQLGYQALAAHNGMQAVEIYKQNQDKIDLVILDMIMPEMGGSETFEQLRQINSSIKVILSSGYSLNGQALAIIEKGCNGFIQKPFNMNDLSQKIREVLDPKRSLSVSS